MEYFIHDDISGAFCGHFEAASGYCTRLCHDQVFDRRSSHNKRAKFTETLQPARFISASGDQLCGKAVAPSTALSFKRSAHRRHEEFGAGADPVGHRVMIVLRLV